MCYPNTLNIKFYRLAPITPNEEPAILSILVGGGKPLNEALSLIVLGQVDFSGNLDVSRDLMVRLTRQ